MLKIRICPNQIQTSLFNCILVFFFLFPFPIVSIINTRLVCVGFAVIVLLINKNTVQSLKQVVLNDRYKIFVLCMVFCLVIALFHQISLTTNYAGTDYYKFWYPVYEYLFVLLFALFCIYRFQTVERFSKVLFFILLLQAVVIFLSLVSREFSQFIYNNMYFGDDRFNTKIANGTRVVGICIAGATGSLYFFMGCATLVYLRLKDKIDFIRFSVLYGIFMGATFFMGRTGLIIEFILLTYFLLSERKWMASFITIIFFLVMFIVLKNWFSLYSSDVTYNYITNWVKGGISREGILNIIDTLKNQSIPHLSLRSIFGTGIMFGETGSGPMHSDIGYAKTYCAIGIAGALSYYIGFLNLYFSPKIRLCSRRIKIFFTLLCLISFVIEFKEPFMLQYIYPWVVVCLLIFEAKENFEKNEGEKYE